MKENYKNINWQLTHREMSGYNKNMNDPSGPRQFATTHWSLVGEARGDEAGQTRAREALEELCRTYWYPLYAFVRSRGYSAVDAQDLTQAFFTQIIEKGGFASADRRRGRFRSYLLGAMKHFLANEWHRAQTQKRGGQVQFIEWDALDPEARYAEVSKQSDNPELSFLAGTLRGLLDKPADVSKGIRTGSIFMMPLYFWTLAFVGFFQGQIIQQWKDSLGWLLMITIMMALGAIALFQFLGLALRSTIGHAIFRLAVINTKGKAAKRVTLLWRWAIVWLPLFIPMSFAALLIKWGEPNAAFILSVLLLVLWISAAVYAVIVPNHGLHDRLARTWVVRR
ncbi:MAG: hypothetical protein GWN55_07815 [Phycisphaerae bacterium]|nr:hypothetical protein [Phycisphaerae bacterium]NIU25987.1 hypothetical protein [candidate division KSB1 bacterium]NIS54782.1 hypothetical protein [Phycisphaerae bacterium]NIV01213.1 hypothetical protein [Phycisphaerae bacterium]NIV71112.1 hypothetical protein [Phycisphaerae bacterium]